MKYVKFSVGECSRTRLSGVGTPSHNSQNLNALSIESKEDILWELV